MALNDLVRNGVALANNLTVSLQDTVTHTSFGGNDGFGGHSSGSAVTRKAIVEKKQKLIRNATGENVMSSHSVAFLSPVNVDPRDKIVLSDGTTGKILNIEGLINPSTDQGYYCLVYLG